MFLLEFDDAQVFEEMRSSILWGGLLLRRRPPARLSPCAARIDPTDNRHVLDGDDRGLLACVWAAGGRLLRSPARGGYVIGAAAAV